MSRAPVTPSLGAKSFSCPHCGALADQHWFKVVPDSYSKGAAPGVFTSDDVDELSKNWKNNTKGDDDEKKKIFAFFDRFEKNDITYFTKRNSSNSYWEMVNVALSQCHSCDAFAIWVRDGIVYPEHDAAILPHEDMPPDVRVDFVEASEIAQKSPRGAAALLRLAIQKLMPHLEEKEDNLNAAIANLVKKGLDKKVQQALDIVRVTGNNAVHPGEINLQDDRSTATQLFALLNIIVQATISAKAQIEAMYASLPEGALKAIEKRDGG